MHHPSFAFVALLLGGCAEEAGMRMLNAPTPPSGPEPVVERFEQDPPDEKRDVLWVIDDSSSMADEQEELAYAFPEFMEPFVEITALDYHVGVLRTDMDAADGGGRLRTAGEITYVDAEMLDPVPYFEQMGQVGSSGSDDAQGLAVLHEALTTHRFGHNAGFLRDDASLAVIFVADGDDASDLSGLVVDDLVDLLLDLKDGDRTRIDVHTVVEGGEDCPDAEPAPAYEALRAELGGETVSICAGRWDGLVDAAAEVVPRVQREFVLSREPVPDSLLVWIEDEQGPAWFERGVHFDYRDTTNAIRFSSLVPDAFYAEYLPR